MKSPISKELLFEYFSGNASALQKKLIDEWVKDPENEELFFIYLEAWEKTYPQYITDVRKAVSRYHAFLAAGPAPETACAGKESVSGNRKKNWLYAASLFLAGCLSAWFFRDSLLYSRFQTQPGQIATRTLPDGSRVTLNANSTLAVPRFWRLLTDRQVFLSGEAEFAVTHTVDNRKFIVKTGNNLDVVVLGTVFTVFNRHCRTRVALNEGKVRLERADGKKHEALSMLPGDRVLVAEDGAMQHTRNTGRASYASWKEFRFEFDETPLHEVAQLLSDNYSIEVTFENEEIARQSVTGSFVAVSSRNFLDTICQIAGLRYERSGNKVHFLKNP